MSAEAVQAAAKRGWRVFPLRPRSKLPAVDRWEERATCDVERLRAYWESHPNAGYGIACGPSGLLVVDLDGKGGANGPGEWFKLRDTHSDPASGTYMVVSPNDGLHNYLEQPEGVQLRNTAGKLAEGIDTRGHGGYVVGAGTQLDTGTYEAVDPDAPVTPCPAWLVRLLTPKPRTQAPVAPAAGRHTRYGAAALERILGRLAATPEGRRNVELNTAAFSVGQLVAGGELDADAVSELGVVASRVGLSESEALATIASGVSAGMARPRSAPR